MHEALPKSDPAYGSVQNIDGRLYVGGAGPEARKAREREEAKARQREEAEVRAEAERVRVAELEERYGPLFEAWPAVRAELLRRQEEAEARLRAELVAAPVFGALIEVWAAQRAVVLGGQEVAAARSQIDGRPRGSMPPVRLDVLELVRELAEGATAGVLAEARALAEGGG